MVSRSVYPERNDDTLRLSSLIELAGKYKDSQVLLVDLTTGEETSIILASFTDDGRILLST